MNKNLLLNSGFEENWGDEHSHNILRIPESGIPEIVQLGNVFSPPGWLPFFRHIPGVWDQPEVKDAHKSVDAHRVRSGEKAILLFTFGRRHDAGFLQQVAVTLGTRLHFSAFVHAWSNHNDVGFPHPNDGRWSEGAGYEEVAWTFDEIPPLNKEQQNDAKGNFRFCAGIDPTGNTNPLADTVEWGSPLYCYNGYTAPVTVEAVARADTVTVFVRSTTLWAFKHNDMYLDDAELIVVADPPDPPDPDPLRGHPREDYERTYLLLPPEAGEDWAAAAVDGTWDDYRYTIGGSADDAGVGDLTDRTVIAVNPGSWPGDLRAFFEEWYPGVVYVPIHAETPADLYRVLTGADEPSVPLMRVGFNDPDDQGAGDWMLANGVRGPLCIPLFIGETARKLDFSRYADAGIQVYVNLRYSWSVDKGGAGTLPPFTDWQPFADACVETIRDSRGVHGWTIGNEVNNPREWPRDGELTPHYVAAIYNYVADVVSARLSPGAVDPFFGPGSSCLHWFEVIWERVNRADFVDVHGYIRGPDADLCWSDAKFDHDPLKWQYLNYLGCIRTLLEALPQQYAELPVLVSEFNHIWRTDEADIGWANDGRAGHVVRSASVAAQEWNESGGRNPIAGLCVYRWGGDEWEVRYNPHVLDAVAGLALVG